MKGRFRGNILHTVDQKGRVSIPMPFRRVLEEGDPDFVPGESQPQLVIVPRMHGRACITCYTMSAMQVLEERILDTEDADEKRLLLDSVIAKAQTVALDDNGRIVLSGRHRQVVGMGENALFVGMLEWFEIWPPEAREAEEGRADAALTALPPDRDPFRRLSGRLFPREGLQ